MEKLLLVLNKKMGRLKKKLRVTRRVQLRRLLRKENRSLSSRKAALKILHTAQLVEAKGRARLILERANEIAKTLDANGAQRTLTEAKRAAKEIADKMKAFHEEQARREGEIMQAKSKEREKELRQQYSVWQKANKEKTLPLPKRMVARKSRSEKRVKGQIKAFDKKGRRHIRRAHRLGRKSRFDRFMEGRFRPRRGARRLRFRRPISHCRYHPLKLSKIRKPITSLAHRALGLRRHLSTQRRAELKPISYANIFERHRGHL
jgi:hypothetical protein